MAADSINILLVDDVSISRKIVIMAIKNHNCYVETAVTGSQAVEMFVPGKYDLVFMDLGLPDMDGLVVTEALRRKEHSTQTPVPILALTANADESYRDRAYEAGVNDFIVKPINREIAIDLIRRFVPHKVVEVAV